MDKLSITERVENYGNLLYLKTTLSELFSQTDCSVRLGSTGGRALADISCPEYYLDIIRSEIKDKLAEIIAIKYKYQFFKSQLKITGLTHNETELLLASLIAADLEEDKKYALTRFSAGEELALDGTFNFRLKPLLKKWADVASYMPPVFMGEQLKDFVGYLVENKKKKVYVENGRVYDSHYRRLSRVDLLSGEELRVVREVLLSGGGSISLAGAIGQEDERYLKEFYGDKIIFSAGNYS